MTMTEQLHFCTSLADATGLPVVADADDGYGGVLQVARTVQSFERAGVAAIVLEDQAAPKHCAFYEDFPLELIDADQMVAKLSMALDARLDQATMIWARSDALAAGHGVDETLERLHAYGSTGVDAIFVPCNDMAALAEYASRWDGPAQLVVSGTAFPHMTLDDAKKLGFAAKLDPSAPVLAALRGMEEVMAEYRRTGSLEHARARSKTSRDFEEIIETSIAADMDRRHSPTRQPAAPKSSG
jgi:2-methylisocitrate lyase-like PEP mutase family enzyme